MNKLLTTLSCLILVSCGATKNSNSPIDKSIKNAKENQTEVIGLRSQMLRKKGTVIKSISEIVSLSKKETRIVLPEGYTNTPGEENYESVVFKMNNSHFTTDCGIINSAQTTINDRIKNCAEAYGNLDVPTFWSATAKGISGEGNWTIASVGKSGKSIIYQDQTTGLLWSDLISKKNWEEAATDQTKVCTKFGQDNDNRFSAKQVAWRLPTRSDYLQADINGARFVLPNANKKFWTASPLNGTTAWSIELSTGILEKTDQSTDLSVRCIGVPLN